MDSLPALTVGMIRILQKKFALPACLQPDMINERMFSAHGCANSAASNGLIFYLICIVDEKIGKNIPWPMGTSSLAKFNQLVIKALTHILKEEELFQLSNMSSISSVLKDKKGKKYERLIFELARNALRITNLNQGLRTVPKIPSDFPAGNRVEQMRTVSAKLTSSLSEKRNAIPIVQEQDKKLLEELNQKKVALKGAVSDIIQLCPPSCKEQMNSDGLTEQNVAVTDKWRTDLDAIVNEQANKNRLVASYNQCVDAIKISTCGNLTAASLINERNGPLVAKTANENNIVLQQGTSVSLLGFMETSSTIAEKLKTLIANRDKQNLEGDFEKPLERSALLLSETNNKIAETEQALNTVKEQSKQSRRLYEEKIAAEGGHRYQLPDLGGEIRVDTPPAPYDPANLIQSPGTQSPKRVLEEARRRRREADSASSNDGSVDTPKSSGPNRSRTGNSSMSQLSKSVLQKQTLSVTLASHANSTICGEPLGASSPVYMPRGVEQSASTAARPIPDTSSLANVLNDLEETDLNFFDLSEGSELMDSTFDSPEPQNILPRIEADAFRSRLPVPMLSRNGGTGEKLPSATLPDTTEDEQVAPLPGSNCPSASVNLDAHHSVSTRRPSTAPAASPARRPRRSIQDIIDRYQKIKNSLMQ